jgi:cell division protein FtsI (penicillin-binding protein 3)
MSRIKETQFSLHNKRIKVVWVLVGIAFFVLIVRATYIQVFPASASSLRAIAEHQYQSQFNLAAYRGNIYDHRKVPLAISIRLPSIAVNPRKLQLSDEEIAKLASILQIKKEKIRQIATKNNYFAWLKRQVSPEAAEAVQKMQVSGIHFLLEPARYYPGGLSAAPMIGYVGVDNNGLIGLELKYDQQLQGESSKVLKMKDARGQQILLNPDLAEPEKPGNNLVLTIDRAIQEITEEALDKGMRASGALRGFAVVGDPHTGRVLAIANRPSFNPNDAEHIDLDETANLASNWRFEPGSVMKPFVIAQALQSGKVSPFTLHNCEKSGRLRIDKKSVIHDEHPKEFLTTEEVIAYSSNICTYKIAQMLGKNMLYDTLRNFGFASSKNVFEFPGAVSGELSDWQDWREIRFSNIAFGQGLQVTGMELLRAYSAFANGGSIITPYLVEKIESSSGRVVQDFSSKVERRPISSDTAKILRHMLERVVIEGSGKAAKTPSYYTAGKTGTAQKFDNITKAYVPTMRIASFAGFAPVEDPYIVILVVLDEPQAKTYFGGIWAAPVFSEIAENTLKYLNVAAQKG